MEYKESIFLKNYNLSIFKKNQHIYVYIYNTQYYCILKIPSNIKIFLEKTKKFTLIYKNPQINNIYNSINSFLKQFFLYEYTKIKFTGKGYKIKKNTNKSLILLFNRSHITILWWQNIFIKKLKKYKIYIKYNNINKNIIPNILNIRNINIFTKKGLRKSRQILLKKKGKK